MTDKLARLTRNVAQLLPPELQTGEFWLLLRPRRHSQILGQQRSNMIVNRVRLFAFLFAVLTPLWSMIDFFVFDSPLWIYLAGIRIIASIAFFSLFMLYRVPTSMLDAYRAMAILFTIPTLFYIASHNLISQYELSSASAALAAGYAFLPFVLMAGLALFPLTLKENILIAALIIAAQLLVGYLNWTTLNWPSFAGGLWLLILISGVVALASLSQLAFMIALVRQAMHDPLTGILARRSGKQLAQLFWRQSVKSGQPLSIAFFDLDHFKAINDRFGHDAGDKVLRDFAAMIETRQRPHDVFVRWGGEEFLLLLPNTSLEQARDLLLDLQKTGLGLRPDGEPLTASMGIAERIEDALHNEQALVELADFRMYEAKNSGRNRVVG